MKVMSVCSKMVFPFAISRVVGMLIALSFNSSVGFCSLD